ncbi:TetR/AcrR family transcriptional regulator [Streptomyces sp. NPDC059373]
MSGRREEILDAAVAIADESGLNAVSMRAVAARVGVTPMALYPHIGSKDALLDGMIGWLLTPLPQDAAWASAPDWRERLRILANAARSMTQRHPWAAVLLFSRPGITPAAVRTIDGIYAALLQAGVPPREVPRLERMVSTFIIGFAASEAGGRFSPGTLAPRARRGQLPDGDLPAHAELAPWLDGPADWDAEFAADLEDLQRMIEAVAALG